MANELDEVTGPTNPEGNETGNKELAAKARQSFFGGGVDKRTASQFTGPTEPYLPKLSKD